MRRSYRSYRDSGLSRPVEPKLQTASKPQLRSEVEEEALRGLIRSIAKRKEDVAELVTKLAAATNGSQVLSVMRRSESVFEAAAELDVLEWKLSLVQNQGWDVVPAFRDELRKRIIQKAGSTSQSTSTLSNLAERHELAALTKFCGESFFSDSGNWLDTLIAKSPVTEEQALEQQNWKQLEFNQKYAVEMAEYQKRLAEYKHWKKTGEMPAKEETKTEAAA